MAHVLVQLFSEQEDSSGRRHGSQGAWRGSRNAKDGLCSRSDSSPMVRRVLSSLSRFYAFLVVDAHVARSSNLIEL